jgi:hypothetical protein
LRKTTAVLKQVKKRCFAGLIETKKWRFFSFYLLLHEVEYNMAWRLVGRTQAGEGIAVGDLDVLIILLKAGGQGFCGTI